MLVRSRRRIAREYLRTWFLLDLVSAVPFDWLFVLGEVGSGGGDDVFGGDASKPSYLSINKTLKVLRLLKILRMLKLQKLMVDEFGVQRLNNINLTLMCFKCFLSIGND